MCPGAAHWQLVAGWQRSSARCLGGPRWLLQAQDLALEDALYALDKALNAGLVQPDAYLKQVGRQGQRLFSVCTGLRGLARRCCPARHVGRTALQRLC